MNPCLPCQDDNVANCECPICVECGKLIPRSDYSYTIATTEAAVSHGPFCAPCIRNPESWPAGGGFIIQNK